MPSLESVRAEIAITRARWHDDPNVREAVGALLEEIAFLRSELAAERRPRVTPLWRRVAGRIVAVFTLTVGLVLWALWQTSNPEERAYWRDIREIDSLTAVRGDSLAR
jgi:hypothetical protein